MINCRINVDKIDKNRIFQGEKGRWYEFNLIETPANQYGNDYMIVEQIPKEEREAGGQGAILGNGKTIRPKAEPPQTVPPKIEDQQNDLPF